MGIEVGLAAGVATVTIANQRKRNALSPAMMSELARVLPELDDDALRGEAQAVNLAGADFRKAFAAFVEKREPVYAGAAAAEHGR